MVSSLRITLAFAAVLLLPAVLLGGWAWLEHGGLRERLRADEAKEVATRLDDAVARAGEALPAIAADPTAVTITRGDDGAPAGPFTAWPIATPRNDVVVAIRIGLAHERAGRPTDALAFFEHVGLASLAARDGSAVLAAARALAATGDAPAARALLHDAIPLDPPLDDGPLDFTVLAALLDARLAADSGDRAPARALRTRLLAGDVAVPAAAARPLCALLDRLAPDPEPRHGRAWCAAADLAAALSSGTAAWPATPRHGGNDTVQVPTAHGVAVVPGEVARHAVAAAVRPPASWFDFGAANAAAPDALATRALPALDATLVATATGTPPSAQLGHLARILLVAAIVTFVLGNLLMLRLVRREIALARARTAFVDTVAHELRTPLQALSMRTEMLSHGDVPREKAEAYAASLHGEVQRLATLVEKALDLARLERGGRLQRQPVAGRLLLARCLRHARPILRHHRRRLIVVAPRTLPTVHVDAEVVARALCNVIENAAKWSPEGRAVVLRAVPARDALELIIEDEGPGIARAERRAVLQPFRRGRNAAATAGSGLGLAIAAQAMRAHRGTIGIATGLSGGTALSLRLPAGEPR